MNEPAMELVEKVHTIHVHVHVRIRHTEICVQYMLLHVLLLVHCDLVSFVFIG